MAVLWLSIHEGNSSPHRGGRWRLFEKRVALEHPPTAGDYIYALGPDGGAFYFSGRRHFDGNGVANYDLQPITYLPTEEGEEYIAKGIALSLPWQWPTGWRTEYESEGTLFERLRTAGWKERGRG